MNAAKRELFETSIGVAIIAGLVVVIMLVFGSARFSDGSYEVTARFSRADGLSTGGIVRAAGVPVGKIKELRLDENFRAISVLRIDDNVELDNDATAAIVTDGLFGQKIIQLDIGGGEFVIGDGQEIFHTEDSLILDDLLELIISRAKQARSGTGGVATESKQ
jgi:phospholipid/cholesterol/gamma-HCH transport system substrate-binding protein